MRERERPGLRDIARHIALADTHRVHPLHRGVGARPGRAAIEGIFHRRARLDARQGERLVVRDAVSRRAGVVGQRDPRGGRRPIEREGERHRSRFVAGCVNLPHLNRVVSLDRRERR